MESTLHQARTISSGTIASLIDENEYDILDRVRYWFICFVEKAIRDGDLDPFTPWQEAWERYTSGVKIV